MTLTGIWTSWISTNFNFAGPYQSFWVEHKLKPSRDWDETCKRLVISLLRLSPFSLYDTIERPLPYILLAILENRCGLPIVQICKIAMFKYHCILTHGIKTGIHIRWGTEGWVTCGSLVSHLPNSPFPMPWRGNEWSVISIFREVIGSVVRRLVWGELDFFFVPRARNCVAYWFKSCFSFPVLCIFMDLFGLSWRFFS